MQDTCEHNFGIVVGRHWLLDELVQVVAACARLPGDVLSVGSLTQPQTLRGGFGRGFTCSGGSAMASQANSILSSVT